MILRQLCLCAFLLAQPLLASERAISPDVKQAARQITDAGLRSHIKYLSSDEPEGRGTGARGDKMAVDYIVKMLKEIGVKPGGAHGSWTQKVPLVGVTTHLPESVTVTSGANSLTLKYFDDYMGASGTQNPTGKIDSAEIVFVGYGIVAPEYKWDDFKDIDVKGKVLLVMNNNPTSFAGKRRLWYGRWDYKYEQAAKNGAAGVIIIHTTPSAAYPWQVVQTSWAGERFMLDGETGPNLEFRGWATEDACRKIAELSGNDLDKLRAAAQSRDFKPVSLTTKISMGMTNTVRRTEAENVIGMLEGSDANLKKEAVIYTAHHDHLGKKGNAIYPGAIDNASGVATVLGIAKAFKALKEPIKRSVYFVFTAGEEQGLLGSQYLALHPPVSPGLMAANINIDTVGFYGKTRDIPVTGLGKSSLDQDLNAIAKEQGRVVKGEEFPEAGAFYRSDQFNLAKIGVPAVFIGAGTDVIGKPAGYGRKIQDDYVAHDYHQPTDIYKESWDMSGAIEDAVFEFALGLRVANAAQMPTWNKGDEFEAVRLKALANEVKTR